MFVSFLLIIKAKVKKTINGIYSLDSLLLMKMISFLITKLIYFLAQTLFWVCSLHLNFRLLELLQCHSLLQLLVNDHIPLP